MFSSIRFSIKYILCSVLIFAVTLAFSFSSTLRYNTVSAGNINGEDRKIIILDAGHGGEDCGAIGKTGVYEKDINLKMAFHLASFFELSGYEVHLTRTEDKLLYKEEENIYGQRKIYDLKNRLLLADEYKNAIFVSLHMNSFPIEKYSGLQVWYQKEADLSYELAQSVQDAVETNLQPENHRKVKQADKSIYLLDRSNHPAILIECGFLSNTAECEKLSGDSYQKELSFVIFCAILNTLECSK